MTVRSRTVGSKSRDTVHDAQQKIIFEPQFINGDVIYIQKFQRSAFVTGTLVPFYCSAFVTVTFVRFHYSTFVTNISAILLQYIRDWTIGAILLQHIRDALTLPQLRLRS